MKEWYAISKEEAKELEMWCNENPHKWDMCTGSFGLKDCSGIIRKLDIKEAFASIGTSDPNGGDELSQEVLKKQEKEGIIMQDGNRHELWSMVDEKDEVSPEKMMNACSHN
jgi:hypothetical protein